MNGLLHHLVLSLKLNFRSKQAIVYGYLVPFFFLIAFGVIFATKPPLQKEMGQLITVTILGGACFGMPTAMVAERERGVWRRYRLLPTAIGGIILSAMVVRYVIVLSAAVLQIFLAHRLLGTPYPDHPWQMLLAFTFVCFAFLGLGLVIAMLANDVPAVQALGQAIFLPMIMIGGVGVPLDKLRWAQHIAAFLPGRYAVQALEACQHGAGLSAAHFDLLSLTVIGVAALLAGSKMFRWDVGRATAQAMGWVALAVLAWAAVGVTAEVTHRLLSDVPTAEIAGLPKKADAPRPARNISTLQLFPHGAMRIILSFSGTSLPSGWTPEGEKIEAATTSPATLPAAVVAAPPAVPKAPWEKITKEQIDSITYDDLPDDNSTNTPLAPDLNGLDDDGKKRMDNFSDALSDWAPGKVEDAPQRIRNLLSICAVADIAEDQNEAHIPYIVFNYLKGSMPKDQLIHALTWVILNDKEGTVLTNVKDIKELALDAEVPEDNVRERATLYGKKLLFRLLGKKPAN